MDEYSQIFPEQHNLPNPDYQELYKAVLDQVIKDFHPFQLTKDIPTLLHSDFIRIYIAELISEILKTGPSQLSQILYRIDISEKNIKSIPKSLTENERYEVLTDMILRREAQKVWIRKKFG